jgi:hypothetical protein
MEGGMLSEQLISKGNEVFWARDTSEGRWLWMPNVYDVVLIALRKDASRAYGLLRRIKGECPMQTVSLVDESEILEKRPSGSVRPAVSRANHPAQVRANVIQMRKRSST